MLPTVAVIGTGGTIASTGGEDGATPTLSGSELVSAVPPVAEYADLEVEEVAQRPSFDMDLETVAAVGDTIREVADDVDGVVVTHGTDTMEESAYFLDLTLDVDVPVVFTGAQRPADELSADGPANLLAAVRAASHETLQEAGGVYLAFDEELHAARDVTKTHTRKLNAFGSPNTGPVAEFTREDVRFHREPGGHSGTFAVDTAPPTTSVPIVTSHIGADSGGIERAIDRGVDGVILEATGVGNTTTAVGDAVETAIDAGVPVVVASRCAAGPVAPVYGTPGGGQTLRNHGAIFAGDLPAQKARLKLLVALAETTDMDDLRGYFSVD
jgi:L-asparaginase